MGEKLPFLWFFLFCFILGFFAVIVTNFRTFNQQPDITQNSPIKQQLIYKGLSAECVLVDVFLCGIYDFMPWQ